MSSHIATPGGVGSTAPDNGGIVCYFTCRHSWCTDALEPTFRTSRLDYLGISGGPSRSVIVGRRHRQQAQDLLL